MAFSHEAMTDEELLRVVDQWEAEGLLEPSWLMSIEPTSTSLSSSSTTPSEIMHRSSFPFPTSAPFHAEPISSVPTPFDLHDSEDIPNTHRPKPSRDPAKRKQQNRNAQRAHRDRQKKLIHDLWAEVHSLRAQNKQLLELKVESHELQAANGRLRKEVEAMERIWVEAVCHGEAASGRAI